MVPRKVKQYGRLDRLPWSVAFPLANDSTMLRQRTKVLSQHTSDWPECWTGMCVPVHPWVFHNNRREMFQLSLACRTKIAQRFVPGETKSWWWRWCDQCSLWGTLDEVDRKWFDGLSNLDRRKREISTASVGNRWYDVDISVSVSVYIDNKDGRGHSIEVDRERWHSKLNAIENRTNLSASSLSRTPQC